MSATAHRWLSAFTLLMMMFAAYNLGAHEYRRLVNDFVVWGIVMVVVGLSERHRAARGRTDASEAWSETRLRVIDGGERVCDSESAGVVVQFPDGKAVSNTSNLVGVPRAAHAQPPYDWRKPW